MKLKVLLWGLGYLLKRNFKKFDKFRSLFDTNELDFSIAVKDTNIARKFFINKDGATTSKDLSEPAQVRVIFNDATEAYSILTSKRKDAFMVAIQDKQVAIEGIEKDYGKLMFLQKVMSKIKI